jgi:pimeloyl-ACP methyl ester carboxylesterase
MEKVDLDGLEIAYDIHGEGHPLLLIAPLGYCSWFWDKIVPGLAPHFQVITFDNRGAGSTDKPEGPYTVPMMAADTARLLDELGISRAYVYGHSLGGFIAQELAVSRPDLVSKLVLGGTNHGGQNVIPISPEALEVMTKREGNLIEVIKRGITIAAAPDCENRKPGLVEELIDYRLTNPVPPAQYQAQVMAGAGMANLSEEEVDERMAAIQVPVLILFGKHDRVVPPGNAELMAEKLPNAEIKILPDTGHIFPVEDPEATVEAIVRFLGGNGP